MTTRRVPQAQRTQTQPLKDSRTNQERPDPEEFVRKMMPYSVDAEKRVIGSILLEGQTGSNTGCLESAIGAGVNQDFFFVREHKMIWEAILELHERNSVVDEVTVLDECRTTLIVDDPAGMLSAMTDRIDTLKTFQGHLDVVVDKFRLRSLLKNSAEIQRAVSTSKNFNEAQKEAQRNVESLVDLGTKREVETLKQVVDRVKNQTLAEVRGEGQLIEERIFTGLDLFDEKAKPFRRGKDYYIVVAARPSIGKTSFATQVVHETLCRIQDSVIIDFQLENSRDNHVAQMGARFAHIDLDKLQDASPESVERFDAYMTRLSTIADERLYVFSGALTIEDVKSKCRAVKRKRGRITMVVIDYIQLLKSAMLRDGTDDTRVINYVSRELKLLAIEIGCPFMILAQLNRESDKDEREPRLSDLKGSGSIEQDADRVILLSRTKDQFDDPSVQGRRIAQAKNKYGPVGSIKCGFVGKFTEFVNIISKGSDDENE